jgi:hypothetical protein
MKARIIDISELRKSALEMEAEGLLGRLTREKTIEVTPDRQSARTIKRAFNKAAATLKIGIRYRTRNDKLYVLLK